MKELKGCTEEEHQDYKDIVISFDNISKLAETINKTKQKHEDQARLRKIALKLKGNVGILHQSFIFGKNVEHNWEIKTGQSNKKCDYCLDNISHNLRKCSVCSIITHEQCYKIMPSNCGLEQAFLEPNLITPTRKLIKKYKVMHRSIDMERISDSVNQKPKEATVYLMNDSL